MAYCICPEGKTFEFFPENFNQQWEVCQDNLVEFKMDELFAAALLMLSCSLTSVGTNVMREKKKLIPLFSFIEREI